MDNDISQPVKDYKQAGYGAYTANPGSEDMAKPKQPTSDVTFDDGASFSKEMKTMKVQEDAKPGAGTSDVSVTNPPVNVSAVGDDKEFYQGRPVDAGYNAVPTGKPETPAEVRASLEKAGKEVQSQYGLEPRGYEPLATPDQPSK
mgnify:CR=1 FL=1